jgi:hypothetical protein
VSQDAPAAEATSSAAEQQAPSSENQTPQDKGGQEPRTYTQEEFDRVIGKVRSEERAKFADFDQYREKAERYDEIAEAAKTQEERLQESLANRERETEELRSRLQDLLVGSALEREAAKVGFNNPATAKKLVDWSELEYDDNGEPTNAADLVASLAEREPYLTAKRPASSFDGGSRTPAPKSDDPKTALGLGLLQHLEATRE